MSFDLLSMISFLRAESTKRFARKVLFLRAFRSGEEARYKPHPPPEALLTKNPSRFGWPQRIVGTRNLAL